MSLAGKLAVAIVAVAILGGGVYFVVKSQQGNANTNTTAQGNMNIRNVSSQNSNTPIVNSASNATANTANTNATNYSLLNQSQLDQDGDGLPNDEEFRHGTDPAKPDSDGDSYSDFQEIQTLNNPLGTGRITADHFAVYCRRFFAGANAAPRLSEACDAAKSAVSAVIASGIQSKEKGTEELVAQEQKIENDCTANEALDICLYNINLSLTVFFGPFIAQ